MALGGESSGLAATNKFWQTAPADNICSRQNFMSGLPFIDGDDGWCSHEAVLFETYLRLVCVRMQRLPAGARIFQGGAVFMLENHQPPGQTCRDQALGQSKMVLSDSGLGPALLIHRFHRPSAADSFEGFRVGRGTVFSQFKPKV